MFEYIAAIILGVIAAVSLAVPYFRRQISADKLAQIEYWVNTAVMAAEQMFSGKSGAGEEKKLYAFAFLQNIGLALSEYEIDGLIEKAVYMLRQSGGSQ